MDRATAEQDETAPTAAPPYGQRPAQSPQGFHEPFDGMGYLDDMSEDLSAR